MLLFRKLWLTASRKTLDTRRACLPQAVPHPAKTAPAMGGMTMIAARIGTDMTATGLLTLTDRMGTGTTATGAGTAAGIAAGTAVGKGVGQEASLAMEAAGMGQGPLSQNKMRMNGR